MYCVKCLSSCLCQITYDIPKLEDPWRLIWHQRENNEETSFWWGWWEEPLSHQWNLFCQQEQLVDSRQPLSFIFALNPLWNLCHSKFTFHIACILIFGTPLIAPRCSQIEDEKMVFKSFEELYCGRLYHYHTKSLSLFRVLWTTDHNGPFGFPLFWAALKKFLCHQRLNMETWCHTVAVANILYQLIIQHQNWINFPEKKFLIKC